MKAWQLAELESIENTLHRMANGAGTVRKMTLGDMKSWARSCRDDLRRVIQESKTAKCANCGHEMQAHDRPSGTRLLCTARDCLNCEGFIES